MTSTSLQPQTRHETRTPTLSPIGTQLRWLACLFGAPLDRRLLPWGSPR
jgi:hypothetical protein